MKELSGSDMLQRLSLGSVSDCTHRWAESLTESSLYTASSILFCCCICLCTFVTSAADHIGSTQVGVLFYLWALSTAKCGQSGNLWFVYKTQLALGDLCCPALDPSWPRPPLPLPAMCCLPWVKLTWHSVQYCSQQLLCKQTEGELYSLCSMEAASDCSPLDQKVCAFIWSIGK